jgi:hypothetical protein
MNYFYRMSDFKGPEALEAKGHGVQNNKVLCKALTTLGVVDSITAAERLVSDRKSGQSKASRLLNRFVSVSWLQDRHTFVAAGQAYFSLAAPCHLPCLA